MAFDGFFLTAVLNEMRDTVLGGRVEKIHEPSRDTVILHLRCETGRFKLLLAANPTAPRVHLTTANPENPPEPPMFCMLLRKHLQGARLTDITQPPMERLVTFTFDGTDEMGFPVKKRLLMEMMGRTCNLYLLDESGRILDCLRRIGLDESTKRQALPGLYYQEPEPIEKENPQNLSEDAYISLCGSVGADELAQHLMDSFGGLSPLVCREAALFAAGDTDVRRENMDTETVGKKLYLFFQENLNHPTPCYTAQFDGTPKAFAFCPLRQYGTYFEAEGFSQLLDSYYTVRDRKDAIRQKSTAIRKTVNNGIARITKKLAIQEKELLSTLDRERTRQLGDIVTANIHRIIKGQTVIECEDFYDEEMKVISIPISPILSPQQNAAKFYKDYTRMKNAEKELTRQMELGENEREYLRSVAEELDRADTEQELEEIRQELVQGGYVRGETGKKRMNQAKSAPQRFVSSEGIPIFVGKNNRQNDELTFKLARKDDIWLHAQKIHGSHVIIACAGKQVSDETITEAAQLAAFYSEGKMGQNIAVDVTPVKQVKKPAGAKPGMVVYYTYRTVYVNPKAEI